jgi:hypothetical protein
VIVELPSISLAEEQSEKTSNGCPQHLEGANYQCCRGWLWAQSYLDEPV